MCHLPHTIPFKGLFRSQNKCNKKDLETGFSAAKECEFFFLQDFFPISSASSPITKCPSRWMTCTRMVWLTLLMPPLHSWALLFNQEKKQKMEGWGWQAHSTGWVCEVKCGLSQNDFWRECFRGENIDGVEVPYDFPIRQTAFCERGVSIKKISWG